jgi:hypothetical protein
MAPRTLPGQFWAVTIFGKFTNGRGYESKPFDFKHREDDHAEKKQE